jgi:hypothetical protein
MYVVIFVLRSSMAHWSVLSPCDRGSKATLAKVGHRMGAQNLLCRAPSCFGRHVKPLVLATSALVSIHLIPKGLRQAGGWSYTPLRL